MDLKKSFLFLLILFLIVGCGSETKYDFKLTNARLRKIRNKYLALSLEFNRTVRSIGKDDNVELSYQVYPSDDSDFIDGNIKNVTGFKLEDDFLLEDASSLEPKDYYKIWISISRKNKVITTKCFSVNNGVSKEITRKEFDSLSAPAN